MSGSYTRADLRLLTAERLAAGVPALAGVVSPSRVHPQMALSGQYPSAMVYADTLRMVDQAPTGGAPEFRATVSLSVIIRVEALTEEDADAQLDALSDAAVAAFLEDPDFVAIAEGIPDMTLTRERRGDSDSVLAQETIMFDMRFTDRREPAGLPALTSALMILDAIDPADPLGEYEDLAAYDFPAAASPPRESGPDGRPEGVTTITFPQP